MGARGVEDPLRGREGREGEGREGECCVYDMWYYTHIAASLVDSATHMNLLLPRHRWVESE